jgi:hypothetical protein
VNPSSQFSVLSRFGAIAKTEELLLAGRHVILKSVFHAPGSLSREAFATHLATIATSSYDFNDETRTTGLVSLLVKHQTEEVRFS